MALLTRVARLFRADLHAVLDRIEEPETLLRQSIREMEAALGQQRVRAKLLDHERDRLAARAADLARAAQDVEQQLDVSFEAENDALARTLVRRRLEAERLGQALAGRRAGIERDLAEIEERVEENEARLDAMRQKAEILGARDAPPDRDEPELGTTVSAADVEVAFLREKRKRRAS